MSVVNFHNLLLFTVIVGAMNSCSFVSHVMALEDLSNETLFGTSFYKFLRKHQAHHDLSVRLCSHHLHKDGEAVYLCILVIAGVIG